MVSVNSWSLKPVTDETTKPAMMMTKAVWANTVPKGPQRLRSI
jgi:hypothetical protein